MPRDYHRTEVHFCPETRRRLEKLKRDMRASTGKKLSMNDVVVEIVELFLEKTTLSEKSEESTCVLPGKM